MIFQSFSQLLQNNPSQHYSPESWTSQKTPWDCFYCCLGSLVAKTKQRRKGNGDSGHGRARWRRGRGGGARGDRRGPIGGLGARGGGLWRRLHGGRRRCCAAPAEFRRGVEVMAGPGSFVGTRASGFGGWWRVGRARSMARRGGATGGHGERRRALTGWRRRQAQPARPWRHLHARERRWRGREGSGEQQRETRGAHSALAAPWPNWPRRRSRTHASRVSRCCSPLPSLPLHHLSLACRCRQGRAG